MFTFCHTCKAQGQRRHIFFFSFGVLEIFVISAQASCRVPERLPSAQMPSPSSDSVLFPCGRRVLFLGSGGGWGGAVPPVLGLGLITGCLFICLSTRCLLNLFTILLTFTPEGLAGLSSSSNGREDGRSVGFGGRSGLGLTSANGAGG